MLYGFGQCGDLPHDPGGVTGGCLERSTVGAGWARWRTVRTGRGRRGTVRAGRHGRRTVRTGRDRSGRSLQELGDLDGLLDALEVDADDTVTTGRDAVAGGRWAVRTGRRAVATGRCGRVASKSTGRRRRRRLAFLAEQNLANFVQQLRIDVQPFGGLDTGRDGLVAAAAARERRRRAGEAADAGGVATAASSARVAATARVAALAVATATTVAVAATAAATSMTAGRTVVAVRGRWFRNGNGRQRGERQKL